MDTNWEVFFDDHRVLQLVVITTPPFRRLRGKGKSALPLVDAFAVVGALWSPFYSTWTMDKFANASRLKRLQRCREDSSGLCHLVHVWFVFQSVSIGMSE